MWETQVQPQGWEDSMEKGMAIHSSILAWRIPWTEEPGKLQSIGFQRVGHDWTIKTHTHTVSLSLNPISQRSHKTAHFQENTNPIFHGQSVVI